MNDDKQTKTAPAGSPPATGYDAWMLEVKRIAKLLGWSKKAIDSIDVVAWKSYYMDGYTPAEGWQEEYDAAS